MCSRTGLLRRLLFHWTMCLLPETLSECYKQLSQEVKDLYVTSVVPEVDSVPTSLEFLRDWVCPNKPVIFKKAVQHWPALKKWTSDYLRLKIGDNRVTVSVTPNGYADAVQDGYFMLPEERFMQFSNFLDTLEGKRKTNGVFYVQKQNSNFTDEFVDILGDAETNVQWASEAFGKEPDAINFWMGDGRAVTSLHKDHYENIYCVVKGVKRFILLPPTDLPWVAVRSYPSAVYKETSPGKFDVMEDKVTGHVPWIAVDPLDPDLSRYPDFANASPVECTVESGDVLYLPSLWYHYVRQSHGCIAVNFWYDMEYDIKYAYHKFLEQTTTLSNLKK